MGGAAPVLTEGDLDRCFIPETLRELIRVIGVTATLRLVERRGGLVLTVPSRLPPDHPLVAELGGPAAEGLVAWGAGDRIYIPRAEKAIRYLRDQEIRRRYDAGEGAQSLALDYRLSERRVWAILSMADPDMPDSSKSLSKLFATGQLSLFFDDLPSSDAARH